MKSVGAVICYKNKYLIQKRNNKKNIYFPNLCGVFGGAANISEKNSIAIIREIHEELNIKINSKQAKFFLKVSINSKHFKKYRSRYYYFIKISRVQFNSINLREGKSLHLVDIKNLKKLNFVPWDLSAILYYDGFIKKNKSVKPRRI